MKPKIVKAKSKPQHIIIYGQKDPRGPDNTITVWIDDEGDLRIKVQKPSPRCYEFSHLEDNPGDITIVQKR